MTKMTIEYSRIRPILRKRKKICYYIDYKTGDRGEILNGDFNDFCGTWMRA